MAGPVGCAAVIGPDEDPVLSDLVDGAASVTVVDVPAKRPSWDVVGDHNTIPDGEVWRRARVLVPGVVLGLPLGSTCSSESTNEHSVLNLEVLQLSDDLVDTVRH